MKMVDFHTHILPGVDDGSDSSATSLAMLQMLEEQGIDTVVLSPHYYSNQEPIEAFLERRNAAYEAFAPFAPEGISLRLGAEVFYSDYLFNNSDLSQVCVDGTRTILLELPFSKPIDQGVVRNIDRLIGEYNVTPVLAHIERYPSIVRSKKIQYDLLDIGCYFQINISSFALFGKRKLLSIAKAGLVGALGTDAHNLTSRAPKWQEGLASLNKAIGQEGIEEINEVMKNLLTK